LREERSRFWIGAAVIVVISVSACGKPVRPMNAVERGRIVYMTNCILCHNPDPTLPGSQGPPIAGSSRELIYDRVMLLTYPSGYRPKRPTHSMRALPQLKDKIDDLTAFLDDAAQNQ
jgi:mono/diheme cytochrome c family protein